MTERKGIMSKQKKNSNRSELDIDSIVIADVDVEEIENREMLAKEVGNAAEEPAKKPDDETAELADIEVEDVADYVGSEPSYAARMRTLGEDDDEAEDRDDSEEISAGAVRQKRAKGDVLRRLTMLVALGVFVFAAYQLIAIFMEYKAGTDEYDSLAEYAHEQQETPDVSAEYIEEDPFNPDFVKATIDWNGLKAENGEVCGWIQFETIETINYPIVQGSAANGTGNSYYLTHTFRGASNSAGSIFVEEQNAPGFADMNTIVYGHNMKNGSMFGLLGKYKDADYYAGNEYFWIYTPEANYRYKIFSCYEPLADSETYTWWSQPCDDYTNYLNRVASYSKYATGVEVQPTDKIVTLSTCTSRGSDYRFVVHAKLIYSESIQN